MCEVPLVSRPEGIKIELGPHLEGRHHNARTSGAEDEYSQKNVMGWHHYILIKCSILVVRIFH